MTKKQLVTLEWINTAAGRVFLEKNSTELVFIQSDNGIWGEGSCGYVDAFERAGIYTLKEAYEETAHCGPEKQVRYRFVPRKQIYDMITRQSRRLSYLIEKL